MKHINSSEISDFLHPSNTYRSKPFWAWNCRLDPNELRWQIDQLQQMGFGGFTMHARSGLDTPYMGKEFLDCVVSCVRYAEEKHMQACLYDEDRWPSGTAGGMVTRNPAFRQKYLRFTTTPDPRAVPKEEGVLRGLPYRIGCFDFHQDAHGDLVSYEPCPDADTPRPGRWFVYVETAPCSPRYNGAAYVDVLNEEAIADFLQKTHEEYRKHLEASFGRTVPSIFTDEPQMKYSRLPEKSLGTDDCLLAWTTDFPDTFSAAYGYDLIPYLPELVWNLSDGRYSRARYHYHDHACERFTRAFLDPIGRWCQKNGLEFTGHVVNEEHLYGQTNSVGEVMRNYRAFSCPGVDNLCGSVEPTAFKQCQSVVRQYGKKGMMSELYGVTGWNTDFRDYKFQGDWQAALGVTMRVPHLSWVSMKGPAKRDYPATLNYQSSWYREFPLLEDHYARLATVLSRGKSIVRIAVLHPIESSWLLEGPKDRSHDRARALEDSFEQLTAWLLKGHLDFDFFSESNLPVLYRATGQGFTVGQMTYDAVLIPPVITLRKTTLQALSDFVTRGGEVIFTSSVPTLVDGVVSEEAQKLYRRCRTVPFSQTGILDVLSSHREVDIRWENGDRAASYFYQLRETGRTRWLFLARGEKESSLYSFDYTARKIRMSLKGLWDVTEYDTLTGRISPVASVPENGNTVLSLALYASDSLLLRLDPASDDVRRPLPPREEDFSEPALFADSPVSYDLSEPNMAVLDHPEYSLDGVRWEPAEEMLRIDSMLRQNRYGTTGAVAGAQPWTLGEAAPDFSVFLRFRWPSELEVPCSIGFESAESLRFNGQNLPVRPTGWIADKSIRVQALPPLRKGTNELIVQVPFGRKDYLENLFLLGDFGVRVEGTSLRIVPRTESLFFGSITSQGLPFYSGAVTYHIPVSNDRPAHARIVIPHYAGAVMRVHLDGNDLGPLAFSPYRKELGVLPAGVHRIDITLYLSRNNMFGSFHHTNKILWQGPSLWYQPDDGWSYAYHVLPAGILEPPRLYFRDVSQK